MEQISPQHPDSPSAKMDWEPRLLWFGLFFGVFMGTGLILFHWMHFGGRHRSLTETVVMSLLFAVGIVYITPWIRRRLQ
jgi:hypothetical protein